MLGLFELREKFWIVLLWFIPFLWILGFYWNRWKFKKMRSFFGKKSFKFLTSSLSLRKREWKRILECLALFFFIFALMRPQWGKSLRKIKSYGIELIILFDVSKSMLAEDVKPSRLEFAKREVIRFLDLSKGDRIGLLVFAGSSILLSPLTSDYSALKMYVESLSQDSISTQGTDYARALLEARDAFHRGGMEGGKNNVITRAILIVSDGEDNEKGVSKAIEALRKEKIYVFSLLFGTEKGGVIPLKDKKGEVLSYQKNASGQVVLTKAKGDFLKSLSLRGKGSFYHALYGRRTVFKVREDIEKLQKAEFGKENKISSFKEQYQVFLLFGFLLALIELLLGEKKNVRRKWIGRFMPFSFFVFLFFIPQDGKSNVRVILKNNKGARLLRDGKAKEAKNNFLFSLREEPMNPLHHFHLGLAFEQNGEKEKAIKQYKTALDRIDEIKDQVSEMKLSDKSAESFKSLDQVQFRVLFNLARLYGEERNFSKALKYYQGALDIQPNSKPVKENIEMLWNQGESQNQSSSQENKEQKQQSQKKEKEEENEGEGKNSNEDERKNEKEKRDSEGEKEKKSSQNQGNGQEKKKDHKNQENKDENEGKNDKNKERESESSSSKTQEQRENESGSLAERRKSKPFKSEDLKESDVLRIFEEIKNQEQGIRAKEFEKGRKEEANEKGW